MNDKKLIVYRDEDCVVVCNGTDYYLIAEDGYRLQGKCGEWCLHKKEKMEVQK